MSCSNKTVQFKSLSRNNIKIEKSKNFSFYAYFKDNITLTKISKEKISTQENEEVIRVYQNSYYPIYDIYQKGKGCRSKNKKNSFCHSLFTIKDNFGLDTSLNIIGSLVGITLSKGFEYHKIFDKKKFKESILFSKLPLIKKMLIKQSFTLLNINKVILKKQKLNKISLSNNINSDFLIIYDKESKFKDIVDIRDLKEKDIFESISILTQKLINIYLKSRTPTSIITSIPAKIQKPTLPLAPKLIKNEFETKDMFQKRVEGAMREREKKMEDLQINFREAVEVRNQKVEELKRLNLKNIHDIEKEQKEKKRSLKNYIPYFTSVAMQYLVGNLDLKNLQYDAENGLMYANLFSQNKNYHKKIYLKIPLSDAQNFKNKKHFNPTIIYKYDNNKLILTEIKVDKYQAKLSQKDFKPQEMVVKLKDIKLNNNIEQTIFEPQNPNLKDRYSVVGSIITEDIDITIANFQDDLPNLLEKASTQSTDSQKWLFVIGAEKYDNTDSVIYSKRSANMFVQVAQKTLGVTQRNTYALIGKKATSGAIEDKLNRMLENVKKSDTIYFFYSGHGIPVLPNRVPYLLPKDKIPDYIGRNPFFKLDNIYNLLSNSKASKIIAVMDSCFSGSTDGRSVFKGVAGSVLIPKKVIFNHNKMVVITAGREKQFSNMYPQKGHRLFSYFIMKSLLEGKRGVREVYNSVYPSVKSISNGFGDLKRQEPTIEGNEGLRF
jgi:hypothetical protein